MDAEIDIGRIGTGETRGHAQVRKRRKDGWTPARRRLFLEHLSVTSNVDRSARAAGMSDSGAYELRRRDPEFRAAWAQALREGYEALEMVLLERARFGTEKPVFHGGKQVGAIRSYSDATAVRLLTAHRAAVEAERTRELARGPAEGARAAGELMEDIKARLAEMKARREALDAEG